MRTPAFHPPTAMKDSNSRRNVEPLDLFDIWRCVSDAMNLSDLRWLLYDEKRGAQWLADLERHDASACAQPVADADPESANPEPAPPDMDDMKKSPSTKRPPRAGPVKRAAPTSSVERARKHA